MLFGRRNKQVSREIEQLELKLEELETHESERVAATTRTAPYAAKSKPARRALLKHLPREVHMHLPTKSDTATAIRDALSRWRALKRYRDDARLPCSLKRQ
jgi:hypothetical protein